MQSELRKRHGYERVDEDRSLPRKPASISGNADFDPSQFEPSYVSIQIPWKSLILGLFLLACSLICFFMLIQDLSHTLSGGKPELIARKNENGQEEMVEFRSERFWSLIILGFISFPPGIYVTFLFLMATLKIPGYTYDDVPS